MTSEHLIPIDAEAWPRVAQPPAGWPYALGARLAEAHFAAVCAKAGVSLEAVGEVVPDLVVAHEELFARLAAAGWLGFAESFMAREWDAEDLSGVLAELIAAGFNPALKPRSGVEPSSYDGGELPAELIALSSGEQRCLYAGVFSSGVPTRVRVARDSHSRGAGHGQEPARYFVDVTEFSAPVGVERADLADAQSRAAEMQLAAADCHTGTHLLEHPATSPLLAGQAVDAHATVDLVTGDAAYARALRDQLTLSGLDASVGLTLIEAAVPTELRGRFDAIVSIEHLEQLERRDQVRYLRQFDRLLAPAGRLVVQTAVATDALTPVARRSLDALRAYIWPALDYLPLEQIYRIIDRATNLRAISEVHFGSHWRETLRLTEETFIAGYRDAAAEGFDPVFRRLWVFQSALRRALVDLGMLDMVQLTAVHRRRHLPR